MKQYGWMLLVMSAMAGLAKTSYANDVPMTQGVIKKLDPQSRKLTIKHGPISNLDMSAMTMSFKVKPEISLVPFKEGDDIQFTVVQEKNQLVITAIEKK